MTAAGRVAAAVLLVAALGGCQQTEREQPDDRFVVRADTTDPALDQPGTFLRWGPATEEAADGPVYPPVVRGDDGQISIYEGHFVREPCGLPLTAEAFRGDTITVYLRSGPDTARVGTCGADEQALGYAMLVGGIEAGEYAVRLIHEGDLARPAQLDTVYPNITVAPR